MSCSSQEQAPPNGRGERLEYAPAQLSPPPPPSPPPVSTSITGALGVPRHSVSATMRVTLSNPYDTPPGPPPPPPRSTVISDGSPRHSINATMRVTPSNPNATTRPRNSGGLIS